MGSCLSSSSGTMEVTQPAHPQQALSQTTQSSIDPEEHKKEADAEEVEGVVCTVQELKDGEMKEAEVGGHPILVVKDDDHFYAIGAKCTHYGAPLCKGTYQNGRVRCPWHGACFNVKTGDIEDFPGLDSLPRFDVTVESNEVKVKASRRHLATSRLVKPMSCKSDDDDRLFLLVGGGPAANTCAETLRQEGFKGRIVMVTKEKYLPYDRPKLSKVLNVNAEDIALRKNEFYQVYDIEIITEKEVTEVDTILNHVKFKSGEEMSYNKLLLATGAYPRTLPMIPGADLENITTLRSIDDANFIGQHSKGKHVVIIGTSFIGMEVAACLSAHAQSLTVVDLVEAPFQLALGKDIGMAMQKFLEDKGIRFMFKTGPKEFVGKNGKITEVVLRDDTRLPAELCVLGIGVAPATRYLKSGDLAMTDNGFVIVDKYMRTSKDNVFAAGDVAYFPLPMAGFEKVNVQHWQMAHKHGRTAALNMLDHNVPLQSVPFFWTVLCGQSLRYAGYGAGYDDVDIHGNLEERKFVAFYTRADAIIAVASMNFDPIVAKVADLLSRGQKVSKRIILDELMTG